MAIPRIEELYNPILGFLLEYEKEPLENIRKTMQEYFYIPPEEAFEKDDDKKSYTLFEGRVNEACLRLSHAGLLHCPKRGIYAISKKGERVADIYEDVDDECLWNIREYRQYVEKNRKGNADISDSETYMYDGDFVGPVQNREYKEIREVTISSIMELKKQDARFANLIASGIFMLENGQIQEVPVEVLSNRLSMTEYRKIKQSNSRSDAAIICKEDVAGSGKMKSETKQHREPRLGGGKKSSKWDNSKEYNDIIDDFNKRKEYIDLKKDPDGFYKAMKKLIKKYKISCAELSRRTGISKDRLYRMCKKNGPVTKYPEELAAICLVLKTEPWEYETLFQCADYDIRDAEGKYAAFAAILQLGMRYEPEEVNQLCEELNQDKIFREEIIEYIHAQNAGIS